MRCKIEIDLKRLEENYAAIENYIRKPLIAVVKSNAYGHGLLPIVSAMHRLGVNSFLVATMEEAVLLRKHFRNIAILLLEPGEDFQTMYALRITPCVNSFSYLKQLIETRLPFPIHLKLETGLNRLGIYPSQEKECLQLIEKSRLSVRGVYTHIASEKSYPGQMYLFKKMLAPFSDIENLQIHIGSSHYLIPDGLSTHYRVGLALYGLMKHPEIPLKPILSLKAPVYRVKKVLRGEEIGYHNAGIVKEDGYLCTIPLGYADGWIKEKNHRLSRNLSQPDRRDLYGSDDAVFKKLYRGKTGYRTDFGQRRHLRSRRFLWRIDLPDRHPSFSENPKNVSD